VEFVLGGTVLMFEAQSVQCLHHTGCPDTALSAVILINQCLWNFIMRTVTKFEDKVKNSGRSLYLCSQSRLYGRGPFEYWDHGSIALAGKTYLCAVSCYIVLLYCVVLHFTVLCCIL